MAEQPALWTNLDLVHRIGESPEYGLVEVLTMARQRSLQRLTLNFRFMDKIFWEDCVHFLQVVADLCPSVKRLSWDKGGKIAMIPNPITHVDKRAYQRTPLKDHLLVSDLYPTSKRYTFIFIRESMI